jgi:tetratricopeptide (TPR) repeat protein
VLLKGMMMSSRDADMDVQSTRLDTWKLIGHYLARSVRTVQRWHINHALPIHHISGDSGAVYAYKEDLDRWLKSRSRTRALPASSVSSVQDKPLNSTYSFRYEDRPWDHALVAGESTTRSSHLVTLAARMWEVVSPRNLPAILHRYREAIDLNPENAAAYAGLSLAHSTQGLMGIVRPVIAYAAAKAALSYGLQIDPGHSFVRCAEAWHKLCSTRDWEGARRIFEEILDRDPADTSCLDGCGLMLLAEGARDRAGEFFSEGARRSPLSSRSTSLHSWCEYLKGDYECALHRVSEVRVTGQPWPILDAVEALANLQVGERKGTVARARAFAAEFPNNDVLQGVLGYAYALAGEPDKATDVLNPMLTRAKARIGYDPYGIALVLIGLDRHSDAADFLEQSYDDGSIWSLGFRSDPLLENLRSDGDRELFWRRLSYPERGATIHTGVSAVSPC